MVKLWFGTNFGRMVLYVSGVMVFRIGLKMELPQSRTNLEGEFF